MIIHSTSSLRYLVVIIEEHLKWNEHILYTSYIRQLFFKFNFLKYILNINILKMVYFALAQSILTNGIVVWDGTNRTWLHKLEVTVKTLLKIIINKDKLFSKY